MFSLKVQHLCLSCEGTRSFSVPLSSKEIKTTSLWQVITSLKPFSDISAEKYTSDSSMCDTDLYHMKGLSVRCVIVCVCVCSDRCARSTQHLRLSFSLGRCGGLSRDADQALPPVHEERDWCWFCFWCAAIQMCRAESQKGGGGWY